VSQVAILVDEAEWKALVARLAAVEQELKQRPATAGDRAFLTPRQVAKRHGIGVERVYAALESGRLTADRVPGKGRAGVWYRVKPADADTWYETFERNRA
jgi:hypothetical protein